MDELGNSFRNIGRIKAGGIAGLLVLVVALFILFTLRVSSGSMVPLFTNLSLDDSGKIVAELEKASVPYELVAGGTQITVPSDRVLRLRMSMAQQGLPSGGSVVGYEIFDRSETLGSSNFVMNVNMMRALEGELARTIGSLSDVDIARVHLVMPKQELFSREKNKPSASVTIKMRGPHTLERAEVTAIAHIVASATPGLDPSRVTIVDGHGRLLARGNGNDSADAAATAAQENRIAFESRMQQSVESMLEKVIGSGKVRVQVAADMNFERVIINSEKYDPEGQVARSIQASSESEKANEASAKDAVSVANNLPQANAAGGEGSGNNRSNDQSNETTNFEISKTTQNSVKEGGTLNKLSVAVLVDGNYIGDDKTYNKRSDEELAQIKSIVASAIGFDEKRGDKIEVVNMRFTQVDESYENASFFERFKLEMQSIIQTFIIAVVAILGIILVVRPAVVQLLKQMQTPSTRVSTNLAALEGPGGAAMGGMIAGGGGGEMGGMTQAEQQEMMVDVANIKGGMKSSSIKKVNEIVDKYPEETMGVLRQWILKQS